MASTEKRGKFRILRVIRRIISGIVIGLVSVFLLSWLLVFIFEKDVIQFASDKLNSQLKSEISFESVELTLLKTFPYASLEFKNVKCKEYLPEKKPVENLFEASYLYLQFNIWDLFSGKYSVKKITLRNADFNLYRDKKGQDNWHIWKESEKEKTEKEKFSFSLSAVKLDRVRLIYQDKRTDTELALDIKSLYLSGNFTEDRYKLSSESEMVLAKLNLGEARFPGPVNLELNATLDVDRLKKTYLITYGALNINGMDISCSGNLNDTEEGLMADLAYTGKKLKINRVLDLIPAKYSGFRAQYDASGNVELEGKLKGIVSDGKIPTLSLNFAGDDVSFLATDEGIRAKNISFKGSFDYFSAENKENTNLNIESFSGNLPASEFSGSFRLSGHDFPVLKMSLHTKADLEEVFSFFKADTIETIKGTANADFIFETALDKNLKFSAEKLAQAQLKGRVALESVDLRIKNSPFGFESVSGNVEFNNRDIGIRELSGFLAGNDFRLSGEALNLLAYLFIPGQDLNIRADLESQKLTADQFFVSEKSSPGKMAVLPNHISLELDARIARLSFKKFEASEVRGKINLKNRVLSAEGIHMKSLGGSIFLNGLADNSSGARFLLACNGNLIGVSVSDLFYRFDNFGQDALSAEHISGKLTAFIEFKGELGPDMKLDLNSIYTKADIDIENGELKKFEPIYALAGWAKTEELNNIRFAQLKNTIYIKNKTVLIPEMAIYSNALDLKIAGEHGFDNVVEYGFNLYLGDILANKFRLNPRPDKQGEFGELIPDKGRTRIFVRMFGPMDNLQFAYDKSAVKEKIMQDIATEKGNVKNILDTEFGKIKNDSLLKSDEYYRQKDQKREKRRKESEGSDEFEFE